MNAVETLNDVQKCLADEYPSGYFLSAVVVIAEVIDDQGACNLVVRRDNSSGIWKHIGMVSVASSDFDEALWQRSPVEGEGDEYDAA